MAKKPKVSLRPLVAEIENLLTELQDLDEPGNSKDKQRAKSLKATLEATSLMLRTECWSGDENSSVYEFPA